MLIFAGIFPQLALKDTIFFNFQKRPKKGQMAKSFYFWQTASKGQMATLPHFLAVLNIINHLMIKLRKSNGSIKSKMKLGYNELGFNQHLVITNKVYSCLNDY